MNQAKYIGQDFLYSFQNVWKLKKENTLSKIQPLACITISCRPKNSQHYGHHTKTSGDNQHDYKPRHHWISVDPKETAKFYKHFRQVIIHCGNLKLSHDTGNWRAWINFTENLYIMAVHEFGKNKNFCHLGLPQNTKNQEFIIKQKQKTPL